MATAMTQAQLKVASNGKVGITLPTAQMPQAALDLGTAQYVPNTANPLFLMYNSEPSPLGGIKMGFYADNFGVGLNLNLVFPEDVGVYKGLFTICGKPTSGTALNRYFNIEGTTGNVGIGGTSFMTNTRLYVKSSTVLNTGSDWLYSIYGNTTPVTGGNRLIGIRGVAYNGTPINSYGKAIGISGTAGNIGSGYNYGVYGQLSGSNYGAGVFGTTTYDCDVSGQYAGFFNGETKIIGRLWLNNLEITSDKRAKKEIVNIDSNNISKLKNIVGIHFKYKSPKEMTNLLKSTTDTTTDSAMYKNLYETVQIGVLAQDVQKVYPELVQTDQNGLLAVNYLGFIPILIESIKEQQKTIDNKNKSINAQSALLDKLQKQLNDLQDIVTSCCSSKGNPKTKSYTETEITNNISSTPTSIQQANLKLYPNAPNPFKESTTIKLEIPETVASAMVCIYDLNGRQLKCLNVSGRGITSVQVFGNELSAGMYHYALIADGSLIDTKTMILTE